MDQDTSKIKWVYGIVAVIVIVAGGVFTYSKVSSGQSKNAPAAHAMSADANGSGGSAMNNASAGAGSSNTSAAQSGDEVSSDASGSSSATTGAEGEVVASKNGSKYFPVACSGAKKIKEENKISFASPSEAEKAGYTMAKNCQKKQ